MIKNRLYEQHTTVRADASATRSYAEEFLLQNKILLTPKTVASFDDKLEVAGAKILVVSLNPMFDVWGRLDHYELIGSAWA